MNSRINVRISNTYNCNIHLSLHNIIDIGMKPDIRNITTIIAALLVNMDLFGNCTADFLFVLGNPYFLTYNSLFYAAYTMILQEATDVSFDSKERAAQGIVLWERFYQL